MPEKRDLRVQKTYNALFEAFHEILNLYHCAQEKQGCQPIIFFVKRAGTVQPSLFLLKSVCATTRRISGYCASAPASG